MMQALKKSKLEGFTVPPFINPSSDDVLTNLIKTGIYSKMQKSIFSKEKYMDHILIHIIIIIFFFSQKRS